LVYFSHGFSFLWVVLGDLLVLSLEFLEVFFVGFVVIFDQHVEFLLFAFIQVSASIQNRNLDLSVGFYHFF